MRILGIQRSGMAPANVGRWMALHQRGVTVGLLCARNWPEGGVRVKANEEQVPFLMYPRAAIPEGRGPYYAYLPSISGVVERFKPDLIHFREEVFTVCGGQFHLERHLKFSDVPFVFESHQNIRKEYPWPARWFESIGYTRSIGAIAGVPSVESVLREGGYQGPIETIPLGGVDHQLFSPEGPNLRTALGLDDRVVVAYVGRLGPEKGIDILLRAAALMREAPTILLCGEGPERARLQELAKSLGVECLFLGAVEQLHMPEVIRSCDVLVLPSLTTRAWKEQWGRVLTEAMACGVPVIGSDSGDIPWVIGDAGLIVSEGSSDDLAAAIERVLSDSELRETLIHAGIRRALGFSWENHAELTERFYGKVL